MATTPAKDMKALSALLIAQPRWATAYREPRRLLSNEAPETPTRPHDGASVHRLDTRRRARR